MLAASNNTAGWTSYKGGGKTVRREEKNYKSRNLKGKRRTRVSSILFALMFALWGMYYLLQSDLMNLKNIIVEGNSYVDETEIINISNLVINRNVFKYNLKEIKKDIGTHPYIKDVKIYRRLPSTLVIQLEEREEYAIIPYMGSYIYIDDENRVLRASDNYMANDNILITGAEFESFKIGEKIETTNRENLDRVMDLLRAANMTSMYEMISEININDKDNIKLITFDGSEVLLGQGKNPAYLMVALDEILINLYTKNVKNAIIDMRYEGHISVRDKDITTWED